ncbi:hypothetical protein LCI18_005061 [Fusarium solani-melongenae]|uniref:Uncharacterized protein n=1 Tax=Fusarium solani subsp. cucurbitae TaxID=2747967 RepID=A0ACD3YYZ4_FUSSC|nr:hypothetical protein LCI18_005061 [Fusarium solani-melongenae]
MQVFTVDDVAQGFTSSWKRVTRQSRSCCCRNKHKEGHIFLFRRLALVAAVVVVHLTSLVMENMATEDAAPYLQPLNPKPKPKGEFHLFPQLSTDLRCMIWQQTLCHERLVFVHLVSRGEQPKNYYHSDPWRNGVTDDYVIFVSQRSTISKLFRVNAEARSCASRFYRVQLPCTYRYGDHMEGNGTLYINPELDTLAISSIEHFVKFAHDIWIHDPRRVGLLNMAMEQHLLYHIYKQGNNSRLREVVSLIRQFWFMFMQKRSCRFRRTRFRGTDDTLSGLKPHFSRPIMAATPVFDRRPDPRPIQADLKQVYTGIWDPRRYIHQWVCLVAVLGV